MDHPCHSEESTRGEHRQSRVLKPVIEELVRTEVHPPLLELLVDKILIVSNVKTKGRYTEAFLIWLSDGEKSIQALLKRDIHPFLTFGDIQEGSYVHVTKYELARGKKQSGDGVILHLRIANLQAVGADGRTPRKLDLDSIDEFRVETRDNISGSPQHTSGSSAEDVSPPPSPSINGKSTSFEIGTPDEEVVDLLQWYDEPPTKGIPSAIETKPENEDSPSKKRKHEDVQSPLQPLSPNVFSSPPKAPRLARLQRSPATRHFADDCHAAQTQIPLLRSLASPKALLPISRPLRLTSLAALTGPHATRNKVVDVFAVVSSVTPTLVRCPGIRPGIHFKRELRITDPSTSKEVMLSVFVEPEEFVPEVGTAALFRSVTTNKWDGGSLNAFKRDCEGREWFLKSPQGIEGCDVTNLMEWWENRQIDVAGGE